MQSEKWEQLKPVFDKKLEPSVKFSKNLMDKQIKLNIKIHGENSLSYFESRVQQSHLEAQINEMQNMFKE